MSRSSYTSSERRGLLAVALVALIIIAAGVVLGIKNPRHEHIEEIPVVVEHPEMIDSVALKKDKETKHKKKTGSSSKKTPGKKSHIRRNPHDEPVSR